MAAIDFPDSPSVNDEFTAGTSVYIWNGTTWTFKQSTLSPSSLSDSNPVMNGSAAAGTSGLASRADHVHPTDTSRASSTHASTHASAGSDPITIAQSQVTNLTTDLSAKAPLASPTFTGTVTVPTPTNATDAATKQYVDTATAGAGGYARSFLMGGL